MANFARIRIKPNTRIRIKQRNAKNNKATIRTARNTRIKVRRS